MIYTNGIPICPNCEEPTSREDKGTTVTLNYYPPNYNEEGININPDRNIITRFYKCLSCENSYTVKGNSIEGFQYGE